MKHLQILLVIGKKYLWFFMTNPVEQVKSEVVGLIPVWILLRNHLFLCNFLFLSAPFQTLYATKAVSAKRPIKALTDSKHDTTGFATKINKYFSPITSRICKCWIWQNSVFLRHPVCICLSNIYTCLFTGKCTFFIFLSFAMIIVGYGNGCVLYEGGPIKIEL